MLSFMIIPQIYENTSFIFRMWSFVKIPQKTNINTKANYRYNYILGNDHSFFYFNYPDLSPVYDI